MVWTKEPRFALIYGTIILPLLALQVVLTAHIGRWGIADTLTLMVPLLIAFSPFLVAWGIRVDAKSAKRTARSIMLVSPLAPDAVFEKLARASCDRCKLVDGDRERRVLVFFSPMRGWSMGFYYPVFITPAGAGSEIEVGLVRRAVQLPHIVNNNHAMCAAEIEKALVA
jgi:hypothetical protein